MKMSCVSFTSYKGNFNLLDSKQEDVQYIIDYGKFADKAKELGLKKSFLISTNFDSGYNFPDVSPLTLCEEIHGIYEDEYMFHGSKKDIVKVIDFLREIEYDNEILFCEDMISKLNDEIRDRYIKLEQYEERLIALEEGE